MRSKSLLVAILYFLSLTTIVHAFPVALKDGLGYTVIFKKAPSRVISLAPSITETIYAVGSGDRLIAVTDYDNYPPEVKEKKSVGGVWNPNKEMIVYLRPDLILGLSDVHKKLFAYLRKLGLTVFSVTPYSSLDNLYKEISDISTIMGKEKEGKTLIEDMKKNIAKIKEESKKFPVKPKVFFVMWDDPLETVGKKSLITKLIEIAGGISITKDISVPFPLYSRAKLVIDNPDIIIFAGGKGGMGLCADRIKKMFKNFNIKAVKNKDIYEIDADLVFRAGPRTILAVEKMHAIFKSWCLKRCNN